MKALQPITSDEFIATLITGHTDTKVDFEAYFKPIIEQAVSFAVGPFCWFIPDTTTMKIVAASSNINLLTPYTQQEWIGKDPSFLAANIHPDDCLYVLSAITKSAEITESQLPENKGSLRVNIYGRMADANGNYRWTLIQFPGRYFNENERIGSAVFMMTDISHLQTTDNVFSPMMTVIDYSNNTNLYYKFAADTTKMLQVDLPNITKREQEILCLMAKGFNTPQIVKELNVAYSTVENHKRSLRRKTNTKTSAELVHYVMLNNLL